MPELVYSCSDSDSDRDERRTEECAYTAAYSAKDNQPIDADNDFAPEVRS